MAHILVADDDEAFREVLTETLVDLGYTVQGAASGAEVLVQVQHGVDLLFLDLRLPDLGGLAVLRHLRADPLHASLPVIVLIAYAGSRNTIEAMKLGAFDHLTKPVGRHDISDVLARALARPQARALADETYDTMDDGLIGASRPMRQVHKLIGMAATSDATVLITGETGTGKERIARELHQHSTRSPKPFVAVNCAAIPTELLESELFGHVWGAFTGAMADRQGRFVEAESGTLFLDEIGDTSLAMQAKILRVIQEREVKPVGATISHQVDIRIIAATHRDLALLVKEGAYREDLFYRLNVAHIPVPPLRERGSDLLLLAEYFLQRTAPEAPKRLTAAAAKGLLEYDSPGNIREPENF